MNRSLQLSLLGLVRNRSKKASHIVACQCPTLAQMRSADRVRKCLPFRVDRTSRGLHESDANDDPERTWRKRLAAFAGSGHVDVVVHVADEETSVFGLHLDCGLCSFEEGF